jgi:hypothetical protein
MHINMTGQTIRKHFQLLLVMGLTMAIFAIWDTTVRLMTPDRRINACLRNISDWQTDPHGTGHTLLVAVESVSHCKGQHQPVAIDAWQQKQTLAGKTQPGR